MCVVVLLLPPLLLLLLLGGDSVDVATLPVKLLPVI